MRNSIDSFVILDYTDKVDTCAPIRGLSGDILAWQRGVRVFLRMRESEMEPFLPVFAGFEVIADVESYFHRAE